MALSDLAVYSEYAYSTLTEVIAQQIELFNRASRGVVSLSNGSNQGDYNDKILWKKISGLVRRRNAYGSGTVAGKKLENLVDTMVKIAAGTPPVEINPSQFTWIQANPELAGVVLGQQLAGDMMADMLNTALIAGYAALSGVAALKYDATGATPDTLTAAHLNTAASKFGDRSQDILAWLVHSTPMHSFYGTAIANASNLFTYGSINVISDPFGRVFIVTDSPALITTGSPDVFNTLGLTSDAIVVEKNDDYTDNINTANGDENILRTWQAEWTYNLGIKGFKWDKSNGGSSPNDAAIATSGNWDKYVSSNKDAAGVLLLTN